MTTFLVVDLETDSLDTNKANISWIVTYDGSEFKLINYRKDPYELLNMLPKYDKILTYNGENFDLPILLNHGIKIDYWKHIDLYQIIKKRATLLFPRGFESLSLKAVSKKLFPESIEQKEEIDYNIFKILDIDKLTQDQLDKIEKYTKADVMITFKIWEYLLEKFKPFADFISYDDVVKLKHITSSTASFGYKAICHEAEIEELWGDVDKNQDEYPGAYVLNPVKEFAKGEILYLDFASLYPMIYVHNNLFSFNCKCCTHEEKWKGNSKWKLNGEYCSKKQGKIEEVVKKFYMLRKEYKKNKDPREQAIKIILNSLYGSSSRPGFIQTYSPTTASDCTLIGQQIIKHAIKQLEDNDFGTVLMSDTDSIVIELRKERTKEECLNFVKKMSQDISKSFPFPWEEFNLKLEAEIKYIQFFKKDSGEIKKKNYIYVDKNDHIEVKGLDIIQKDCSQLSKTIFDKYLKTQITKNLDCKFTRKYIESLVMDMVKNDFSIIAKKFNIKFKYDCPTTLYNDILQTYGSGEYLLVKNFRLGAGKGKKYCSLEEAKSLNFRDLDLSDIWSELEPFIKSEQLDLSSFNCLNKPITISLK